MGTPTEDVEELVGKLTEAVHSSREAMNEWTAEAALETFGQLAEGISEVQASALDIRFDAFSSVLENQVAGGVLGVKLETIAMNEEFANVAAAMENLVAAGGGFGGMLDETTEAGQASIEALASLQSEINDGLNQALIDSGGDFEAVREKAEEYNLQLLENIPGLQENELAAAALAEALGTTPDQLDIKAQLLGAEEARQKLELLRRDSGAVAADRAVRRRNEDRRGRLPRRARRRPGVLRYRC